MVDWPDVWQGGHPEVHTRGKSWLLTNLGILQGGPRLVGADLANLARRRPFSRQELEEEITMKNFEEGIDRAWKSRLISDKERK